MGRIGTRVWLFAGLMTLITIAIGGAVYYFATMLVLDDVASTMPPKARVEFERLIATGQTGSDRFFDLYERYTPMMMPSDLWFIILIAIASTATSGGIAYAFARRLTTPIVAVSRAAGEVAAGERGVRVDVMGGGIETADLVASFNRMAADLEAYERERQVLTAGIAHELRTPLTILKGRLHGLIDGVIDPGTDEAERLLRQVEQLSRIVEDLRTLVHADARQLQLDLRPADLAAIVEQVVSDLCSEAEAAGVTLRPSLRSAPVRVDPVRIRQVVLNLIGNAIRHGGGDIEISTRVEGGEVLLEVADSGQGFAESDRQRLFIPFWRGDKAMAGRQGSGLGLALSVKLVAAHGGRITAENRTDRTGARFTVLLPSFPIEGSSGRLTAARRA